MTYFITFTCYGHHLHGCDSGSVDRTHNITGTPLIEGDHARAIYERERMKGVPYNLDPIRRDAVLDAIRNVYAHREWGLLAAHVRSNHVHAIVTADVPPEKIMVDFKIYASRRLNQMKLDELDRKRWARHGSTRWLWEPAHVTAAVEYVVREQGTPMSVFESNER